MSWECVHVRHAYGMQGVPETSAVDATLGVRLGSERHGSGSHGQSFRRHCAFITTNVNRRQSMLVTGRAALLGGAVFGALRVCTRGQHFVGATCAGIRVAAMTTTCGGLRRGAPQRH